MINTTFFVIAFRSDSSTTALKLQPYRLWRGKYHANHVTVSQKKPGVMVSNVIVSIRVITILLKSTRCYFLMNGLNQAFCLTFMLVWSSLSWADVSSDTVKPIKISLISAQKPIVKQRLISPEEANRVSIVAAFSPLGSLGVAVANSDADKAEVTSLQRLLEKRSDYRLTIFRDALERYINAQENLFRINIISNASGNAYVDSRNKLRKKVLNEAGHKLVMSIKEQIHIRNSSAAPSKVNVKFGYKLTLINTETRKVISKTKIKIQEEINVSQYEFIENPSTIDEPQVKSLETLAKTVYLKLLNSGVLHDLAQTISKEALFPDNRLVRKKPGKYFSFKRYRLKGWSRGSKSKFHSKTAPFDHQSVMAIESQIVIDLVADTGGTLAETNLSPNDIQTYIFNLYEDSWEKTDLESYDPVVEGYQIFTFTNNESSERNLIYARSYGRFLLLHTVKSWSNHEMFTQHYAKDIVKYIELSKFILRKDKS